MICSGAQWRLNAKFDRYGSIMVGATSVFETRDAALLARLQGEAFQERWSQDFISTLLTQPGVVAGVVGDSPQGALPRGMILMRAVGGEAEILVLAVSPAARRRGLARALVRFAAEMAFSLGAECLFLEVGAENVAARVLYHDFGFEQAGLRPKYYGSADKREDALILRVALPLSAG